MHCLGWMRILPRSIWALSYTWLRRLGEIRRFDAKEEEKKKKKKKKKRKSKRSEKRRGSDEEDKENVEVTDDDEDSDDDDNDNDDEKEAESAPQEIIKCFSSRSCMACGTKLPSVSSNGARAKCLRCFARRTWILGMRPGTKMGGF